jgi:metallophosphoesterase superfamily enzyme
MADLLLVNGFYATPQRFLWHPGTATAILSDLHLGIEAALAAHGLNLPPMELPALWRDWRALAERLAASSNPHLIIAGDFFDSPTPSTAAILLANQLFAALPPHTAITFLPGNHDPSSTDISNLFPEHTFHITDATVVAGYRITHGHAMHQPPTSGWIVGHQHPSVVLSTRTQSAKMTCYALCTIRSEAIAIPLILLPTFSRAPLGSNLRIQRHWIVDLPRPADRDIRIAGIIEGEGGGSVLDFGPLSDL